MLPKLSLGTVMDVIEGNVGIFDQSEECRLVLGETRVPAVRLVRNIPKAVSLSDPRFSRQTRGAVRKPGVVGGGVTEGVDGFEVAQESLAISAVVVGLEDSLI